MHRRGSSLGIFAVSVAVFGALLASPAFAGPAPVPVQISARTTSGPLPPSFLGFSFEYRALPSYAGRDPRAVNPVLLSLLGNLSGGGVPLLRIGGDSTDATWWPVRGEIPPGGINYSLSPDFMRTTRALAQDSGAKLILGINLAADRPALAAQEARAILAGVGRRYIKALEIGNEPDVYTEFPWYRGRLGNVAFARPANYAFADYRSDFDRWRSALPEVPLAGPAFAGLDWLSHLDTLLSREPAIRIVTFHRYPLRGCVSDPASPSYASIPNLLADSSSAGLAQQVAPYVALAHARGVPFRLDELNSAACTGRSGVSDTFASALWVLDTLFNLSAVGVDGINLHTLPGAAYEPFAFTHGAGGWHASVRPIYYGLLMFSQAFPSGAQLLGVSAPSGPVKVWATTDAGRVRVVMINKDPNNAALLRLQLPGVQSGATVQALSAPGLASTGGVSYAGASFGTSTNTGRLPGHPRAALVHPLLGYYQVTVPSGSALLLTR
ncbi:MAG: glycosyl hydrolase family 79 C-terminal domain-containing protein [Solirubrobacteraceae bacterium]